MSTDWSDNIVVVELVDEPALSDELAGVVQRVEQAGADAPSVVLNFSSVTYISSSNIAQLLTLRKLLGASGKSLRLCSVSEHVRGVLSVTGIDKLFQFAPDPMTALAGIQIELSE